MISPFFILFSLMAVGYISKKLNWIDNKTNEGLGNILVHIAMPSLLISSTISLEIERQVLGDFILMTVLSIVLFFIYAIFSILYVKILKIPQKYGSMVQLSMLSSNNGFMGFPITIAFFGNKGLLLMVANNLAMGIVLWSYGVFIIKRAKRIEEGIIESKKNTVTDFLKQILNANVLAIIIGLIIGITGFDIYIPKPVIEFLSVLGGLATPLSMIYIGATLYGSDFLALFRNPMIVGVCITRSTVFAILTVGLVYLLPISILMKQISFLVITLPTAAIVPVIVGKYGTGREGATKIVVLSTLLSLVTTPLGVYIAFNIF
ncbi:MAG: AEC family transporter [Anaerovoracaceae bacterium]|jgi:predicted permease